MTSKYILCAVLVGLALQPKHAAAQFTCGSTGAGGALVVPAGQTVTLDVPNDGIFHFTTVTVSGALTFNRNQAFNPPVIILATGDVVVNAGATINVNGSAPTTLNWGAGGPGGFDGGAPGISGARAGSGHGPGAGLAATATVIGGNAGYGQAGIGTSSTHGVPYGSPLLVPLAGGSGGGGNEGVGGGGGGGAILLCSPSQLTVDGLIDALGGPRSASLGFNNGNGSGGAVRLLAPAVRGAGQLRVLGGTGWGGHGRVRIDTIDRSGLAITANPAAALAVGSLMAVFPSTVPRLDIVRVAGNDIAVGTPSPLTFTLPLNAPATQAVTVRATNFTGIVPITVAITPDSGDRILVNADINADVAPAEATVNVDLPQNIAVRVHAWTR
ncbi:MAG: hypothetical protein AB7N65_12195 [Vicinamibacterales bacterium]